MFSGHSRRSVGMFYERSDPFWLAESSSNASFANLRDPEQDWSETVTRTKRKFHIGVPNIERPSYLGKYVQKCSVSLSSDTFCQLNITFGDWKCFNSANAFRQCWLNQIRKSPPKIAKINFWIVLASFHGVYQPLQVTTGWRIDEFRDLATTNLGHAPMGYSGGSDTRCVQIGIQSNGNQHLNSFGQLSWCISTTPGHHRMTDWWASRFIDDKFGTSRDGFLYGLVQLA